MITQKQWKFIEEEFGDDAFRRLKPKWPSQAGCNDNHDIIIGLNSGLCFELKPLPELIAHDIEFYDKLAYLMWELKARENSVIPMKHNIFFGLSSNCAFGQDAEYRRKESAALPFDLERAKAGDVVEYKDPYRLFKEKWKTLKGITKFSNSYPETEYISVLVNTIKLKEFKPTDLRMKYPPKQEPQND